MGGGARQTRWLRIQGHGARDPLSGTLQRARTAAVTGPATRLFTPVYLPKGVGRELGIPSRKTRSGLGPKSCYVKCQALLPHAIVTKRPPRDRPYPKPPESPRGRGDHPVPASGPVGGIAVQVSSSRTQCFGTSQALSICITSPRPHQRPGVTHLTAFSG